MAGNREAVAYALLCMANTKISDIMTWDESGVEDASDEETSEEQSEEEEEPEEQEQQQTFTVKVDGKEVSVTLDELQKGYSRTQDYTRKTQQDHMTKL